jgi:hypothetical protein
MSYRRLLLAALAARLLCPGSTGPPFYIECGVLDRISIVAASQSSMSRVAFTVLEQVALGRSVTPALELEARVGIRPGELQKPEFRAIDVRVHALRSLGRTGAPAAIAFLKKLTRGDLGPDPSHQVWPAAQIGLREGLLNSIAEGQAKTQFLEGVLTEPHDPITDSKLVAWAIDKLCDSGTLISLPVIQTAIRKRDSYRGEEQIQFCEARIQVMRSDPDPVRALGSALRVEPGADGSRLVWWAINRLAAMKSPQAAAELDRFAADIAKLPVGSLAKRQAGFFRQAILELRGRQE